MTERMIEVDGVELCTEPFGDPADRPILLIHGIAASMLWWDERFCRALVRDLVRRDIDRARDYAAARNHDLLTEGESSSEPVSSITAPTLVIHGTADPMFPVENGQALAHEIPGATLLRLDAAGHGIHPSDRDPIAAAIAAHTTAAVIGTPRLSR